MKKSIVIITSEMQLYNAIEAIEYFKTTHNILYISNYTNRNRRILNQLKIPDVAKKFKKVINLNTFDKQGQFYYYISNILAMLRVYVLSLFHRYDYVMIGNYANSMHRYIASRFNKDTKIIVLDDGNLTYSIAKVRIEEKRNMSAAYANPTNRLTRLLNFLMKSSSIFDSVTYFSSLNFDYDKKCDKVIYNNYNYLKANGTTLFNFPQKKDAVYVIGSPFPEIGMLNANDYSRVLAKIKDHFPSTDVVYISHPSEKLKYLTDYPHFMTIHIDVPCEMLASSLPSGTIFLGFCSSAILNVHTIRPDLRVMYIDIRSLLPKSQTVIGTHYDALAAIDKTYSEMSKSLIEFKL